MLVGFVEGPGGHVESVGGTGRVFIVVTLDAYKDEKGIW